MKKDILSEIFPIEKDTSSDLFFFAGPCVVENEKITMETANELARIRDKYKINICFKSSFKKANRTSTHSFMGLDTDVALSILEKVKNEFSFSIIT